MQTAKRPLGPVEKIFCGLSLYFFRNFSELTKGSTAFFNKLKYLPFAQMITQEKLKILNN
jgi:hypothetical protein